MNNNKPSLLEYLKQFSGWTSGVVTFLILQVSFIVLFRKNPQLVTVLIITTTSIALMLISWKALNEKTPSLVVEGKELLKYPRLRRFSIVALVAIPIINLIFFSRDPGKEMLMVSLYGPSPKQFIKAATEWGCIGKPYYIFLPEFDLTRPEFELANSIYSIYAEKGGYGWLYDKWTPWDRLPDLTLDITNLQPAEGGTIKLSNTVNVIIDSYEPLDHIELARFTSDGIAIGSGCGGGRSGNIFSEVILNNVSDLRSTSLFYDYFTLQPGEYEEFYLPFRCGKPGVYKYHVLANVFFAGEESQIQISDFLVTYCPKSFSIRSFDDVLVSGPEESFDVRTITYSGDFEWNNQDIYAQVTSGRSVTRSWKPCTGAPESYIYPISRSGMFNSTNQSTINIRSEPGLDASIIRQGSPGEFVSLPWEELPSCADGMVWWKVAWQAQDQLNTVEKNGWVAEGDGVERWLLSCPGHVLVENLRSKFEDSIQLTDWCR